MGRQVYTYIKDAQGDIVWSSVELDGIECEHEDTFFCGRNEETNVIAMYADNETGEIDITSVKSFNRIRKELRGKQDLSDKIYSRLCDRMDALRSCRAQATSIDNFNDFDAELGGCYEQLDEEYWNRASDMIQLMEHTRNKAEDLAADKQGFAVRGDFAGYTIYWRNDE